MKATYSVLFLALFASAVHADCPPGTIYWEIADGGPRCRPANSTHGTSSHNDYNSKAADIQTGLNAAAQIIDILQKSNDSSTEEPVQATPPVDDWQAQSNALMAEQEAKSRAAQQELDAIENDFISESQNSNRTGSAAKAGCDCRQAVGSCLATITLNSVADKSTPKINSYSAEYTVSSNAKCSKVDYYIDNTPYTTVLNNTYAERESTFGTRRITASSFEVKSCNVCQQ